MGDCQQDDRRRQAIGLRAEAQPREVCEQVQPLEQEPRRFNERPVRKPAQEHRPQIISAPFIRTQINTTQGYGPQVRGSQVHASKVNGAQIIGAQIIGTPFDEARVNESQVDCTEGREPENRAQDRREAKQCEPFPRFIDAQNDWSVADRPSETRRGTARSRSGSRSP